MPLIRQQAIYISLILISVLLTIGILTLLYGSKSESVVPSADEHLVNSTNFDAQKGKSLFVSKGCVVCHSINGVGGQAATALDAADPLEKIDAMDFAARMWHGAPAMISLQRVEFGYEIQFTGAELAALVAFGSDRPTQKTFILEDVPEPMQDWFLGEIYMTDEDWVDRFMTEEWPTYSTDEVEKYMDDDGTE